MSKTINGYAGRLLRVDLTFERLSDVTFDESTLLKSESTIRLKILSVICLPLKHNDNIFGAIYLDNRTVRGMFTPQTCELVESFSDFISLAAFHALEKTQQNQHIALLESELRSKFQFNSII